MDAIAVIDIKDGAVVRAEAGKREKYEKVSSRILAEGRAEPIEAAAAFYDKLGIRKLYIADLDAIMEKGNNIAEIKRIKEKYNDLKIMLDAGFNENNSPVNYLEEFLDYAIIATESLDNKDFLKSLKGLTDQIIISIDLKKGELIHQIKSWDNKEIYEIIAEIKSYGFNKFIILDLSSVGTAAGIADYIKKLKNSFPKLDFITGGGIKDYRDVKELKKEGFAGVLIASAFHNGSLGKKEVDLIENDQLLNKIAWCITGAGHLLEESIKVISKLKQKYNKLEIDIYLSQAGYEVLKIYNYYEKLNDLNCEIHQDGAASSPIIGRLYKGHYDLLVSAPTTSNTAAKFVYGISDTLVTNFLAHAGKSQVPILILPTDIDENLISPAPDKMVDVYPREIDLKNTKKLKLVAGVEVIKEPKEVEIWLKNYLSQEN